MQGVQQVTRTLGERRVHDDRLIVGAGRWVVVFAVVGDHVVNTSLLYYWRRAVVQLDPLGAVAVVGAAVGLMPGGVVLG